jgi:hypothetical protein
VVAQRLDFCDPKRKISLNSATALFVYKKVNIAVFGVKAKQVGVAVVLHKE